MSVVVVDYGAGNLRSVDNALRASGTADPIVTSDPVVVRTATRIILPGVGAFAHCMDGLRAVPGMIDTLREAVLHHRVPFLGICVGMQLLATAGHEHGETAGLGWIEGIVEPMLPGPALRVPHMGWNVVHPARPHPMLFSGEAYFVHSYRFVADRAEDVLALTSHGAPVTAAVGRDNIVGVQFHPEKSQRYGIDLLRRFAEWRP